MNIVDVFTRFLRGENVSKELGQMTDADYREYVRKQDEYLRSRKVEAGLIRPDDTGRK